MAQAWLAPATQFRWIKKFLPFSVMLYNAPLGSGVVVPNVQAHLSAFSYPLLSYQAFSCGSVTASSNSCEMIEAIPSAPRLPFGLTLCAEQAFGQRSGLPIKEYLIGFP